MCNVVSCTVSCIMLNIPNSNQKGRRGRRVRVVGSSSGTFLLLTTICGSMVSRRLYHVSYSTIPLLSMVSRTIYKSRDDFCDEVTHFLNIGPGLVRKTILCPESMGNTAKLYL